MRAGALRERVTFQRRADGADGFANATTGPWTDVPDCVSVAAEVKPMKQAEVVLSEGVQGRVLYQVSMRQTAALAGIRVGDRMIDARDVTRTFNVKAPPMNPDMHARGLQILVEAGGVDG